MVLTTVTINTTKLAFPNISHQVHDNQEMDQVNRNIKQQLSKTVRAQTTNLNSVKLPEDDTIPHNTGQQSIHSIYSE